MLRPRRWLRRCTFTRRWGFWGRIARGHGLGDLLAEAGLGAGQKVGVAGWKYFCRRSSEHPKAGLKFPSYLADAIRALAGPSGSVVNAGALLMDPARGLRATIEIDELARFEFAACHTSEAVKAGGYRHPPGHARVRRGGHLQPVGLPLSCHPMFSSGARAWHGLLSPTSKVI